MAFTSLVIVLGFVIHLLLLKGVLDTFFSSPIVTGTTPIISTANPPAKRVVLIVADGLRAESIFSNEQKHNIPNLSKIMNESGSWTISHTRVFTESRPGHVALLAGIYEDPSALLKGWSNNPVYFDSVINQSTNTWGWGAPSVLNLFRRSGPHVHLNFYDDIMEDFGNKNTTILDAWVVDNVKKFLEEIRNCDNCEEVKGSGNLFFLHLLGIDTAGHGFKPYSEEHVQNVKFVDKIIPIIQDMFDETFSDKKTTYIFTADHGMTNWGSHGGSSAYETETPFIIWGAGVQQNSEKVRDINQVDVAPLISGLLGINYPVNSIGILPTVFLKDNNLSKELLISNVLQVGEIFAEKKRRIFESSIIFVPFNYLSEEEIKEQIAFLKSVPYYAMVSTVNNYIELFNEGINYYQNYYQSSLLISLTGGVIIWILYLITMIVQTEDRRTRAERFFYIPNWKDHINWYIQYMVNTSVFFPLYLITVILCAYQSLPLMYYIYFLFPFVMAHILTSRLDRLVEGLDQLDTFGYWNSFRASLLYLGGIALLVDTFSFRETLCYVVVGIGSSIFFVNIFYKRTTRLQKIYWILNLIIIILYMQPVLNTKFNIYLYGFSYLIWLLFLLVVFKDIGREIRFTNEHFWNKLSINFQRLMLIITPWYPMAVEFGYVRNDSVIKHFAYGWAAIPIIAIFGSSLLVYGRTLSIILGFTSYYFMVSTNLEPSFLLMYATLMFLWIAIESNTGYGESLMYVFTYKMIVRSPVNKPLVDFRRAFFFIVFIFVGFFGTGNIASINSFDPMWVRCFLTVFSPFKMSLLIILRIMVPFIFASCALKAITILSKSNMFHVFCSILIFSDLMLLALMYNIQNVGSWLEIGMSLSHFIIMEAFILITMIMYGIATLLTTSSFVYRNRYY